MKKIMTKTAYKIILGLFLFSVTAVACNNKSKDKEKEKVDSAANRPTNPGDKMAPSNPTGDTTKIDSANNRPTNPGD
jgi:hypothetical protein